MENAMALPRYRSHKEVWALKIRAVINAPPDAPADHMALEVEGGFQPILVTKEYVQKHDPQPGGYWVKYRDGYQSWSPAEAFESGYTLVGEG